MTREMRQLINNLRIDSSAECHLAVQRLARYDHTIVAKAVVDAFMEDDESERRVLIGPLVEHLLSSSLALCATSAFELLQIGHFCIPYLDDALLIYPTSKLAYKIKQEIKALDDALVEMSTGSIEAIARDDMIPNLDEAMIRATKLSITAENDIGQIDEKKLMAFLEINVDVRLIAWRKILVFGPNSLDFLTGTLMNGDVQSRRIAARLLSALHDKRTSSVLINALSDNDVFVRDQVVLALALMDDVEVASQLAGMYAFVKRNRCR